MIRSPQDKMRVEFSFVVAVAYMINLYSLWCFSFWAGGIHLSARYSGTQLPSHTWEKINTAMVGTWQRYFQLIFCRNFHSRWLHKGCIFGPDFFCQRSILVVDMLVNIGFGNQGGICLRHLMRTLLEFIELVMKIVSWEVYGTIIGIRCPFVLVTTGCE